MKNENVHFSSEPFYLFIVALGCKTAAAPRLSSDILVRVKSMLAIFCAKPSFDVLAVPGLELA